MWRGTEEEQHRSLRRWIHHGITKVTNESCRGQMSCHITGCDGGIHRGKSGDKKELTAHRESLKRDTNRGVLSQPDMQCTRRPLSSETTGGSTLRINRIALKCSTQHLKSLMNIQGEIFITGKQALRKISIQKVQEDPKGCR